VSTQPTVILPATTSSSTTHCHPSSRYHCSWIYPKRFPHLLAVCCKEIPMQELKWKDVVLILKQKMEILWGKKKEVKITWKLGSVFSLCNCQIHVTSILHSAIMSDNGKFTVIWSSKNRIIHSFINGSTTALCRALATFSVLWSYAVGRISWTGDQPVARLLPTHRTAQTQNKCTQTSMPWVGFKPTTPVFEWVKTVHALACAATVISRKKEQQ
jgi:hypothetical protein